MTDNIVAQVRDMERKIMTIWTDIYGDDDRHERGFVRDLHGVTSALNRLAIVLVFFALISLLNLLAIVWVVLAI